MDPDFKFVSEPGPCSFLPDRDSQMECQLAYDITRAELQENILQGWRRQGVVLFRPACTSCNACQSYRVVTSTFEPNRSQRRVIKANKDTVFEIRPPSMSIDRVALYVQHHNHHSEQKGWELCTPQKAVEHINMLGTQKFIEEWAYRIDGKLVAISYVDVLEHGLSGVYFYHHPDYRQYSLGTWCVLSLILRAKALGMPHAYLGFYVPGCRSMEYKGRFVPAEILTAKGTWERFEPQAAEE